MAIWYDGPKLGPIRTCDFATMTPEELRRRQAPFKERYRAQPESARATLAARGRIDPETLTCRVDSWPQSPLVAGIHPLAGGEQEAACAGDMLLQALVACAGVTLCAVATAMGLDVTAGELVAEGDLDFRGTLGVSRDAPVGFTAIRLRAALRTTADASQLQKLAELVERYCVVAQSLKTPITVSITGDRSELAQ
jgi:uncharacterized OsmC-like protein